MKDCTMESAIKMVAAFAAGVVAVFLLERSLAHAQRVTAVGRAAISPDADTRLREEVRSRLGGWVSHPRSIEVEVEDGVVRVSGQVLPAELEGLLMQLTALPGVHKVRNALSTLRDPENAY